MGLNEQMRQTELSPDGVTLYSDATQRLLSPLWGFGFRSGRYQGLAPLAITCRSFGANFLSDYMASLELLALLASLAVRLYSLSA